MPNSNPSGPNQPLNQHPLPVNQIYHVAQDTAALEDVDVAGSDYLLVPPPVPGGVRFIPAEYILANLVGAGATEPGTIQLIFKDGFGKEVILSEEVVASFTNLQHLVFYLLPSDDGIFVRVTDDSDDGSLVVAATWRDVRNAARYKTVLSESFQAVHPDVPAGNVLFPLSTDLAGEEGSSFSVMNYDDVLHTLNFRLTDGVTTFAFPTTASVDPGEALSIGDLILSIIPGWHLEVQLGEALGSGPAPELLSPFGLINQGPARQEQGGAY